MTVAIETISRDEAAVLISSGGAVRLNEDELARFDRYLQSTTVIWVGIKDGHAVNLWGVIPPTMISDVAYLWHYLIAPAEEHTFVLARYSRLAVERVLERYPRIVGHCRIDDEDGQRWIRWLGGKFSYPVDGLVPFEIKPKARLDD